MFRLNALIANIRLAWIFFACEKGSILFCSSVIDEGKKIVTSLLRKAIFQGKEKNEK